MNAPDPDRWIALSERLPDKFPCQVFGPKIQDNIGVKVDELNGRIFTTQSGWTRLDNLTHWKPLRLSDPPEPQKSKEEAAFYEWCAAEKIHVSGLVTTARQGWLAALRWKEKNG